MTVSCETLIHKENLLLTLSLNLANNVDKF